MTKRTSTIGPYHKGMQEAFRLNPRKNPFTLDQRDARNTWFRGFDDGEADLKQLYDEWGVTP